MSTLWASLYRSALTAAGFIAPYYLKRRLKIGKEKAERLAERYGQTSLARPEGKLIWLHGASVGETASALPLIEKLLELNPKLSILVTSGTVASADMLGKKLPSRAFHQFVPLDVPSYAKRFMAHWQPDAVIWLESEIWPNLLEAASHIPNLRLNARLTARSARNWQRSGNWFRQMLSRFALTLTISEDDANRLRACGAQNVKFCGNLKFTVPPLPVNAEAQTNLLLSIGDRPTWLMASSHPGEEAIALEVHHQLKASYPDLLTIIVPRHVTRAGEIEAMLDVPHARRSKGELPTRAHEIYLADTMGELGLFFRLSQVVCVGGSFTPKGGHSPIEPAQCGCAVLMGPDTSKCADIAEALVAAGAMRQLKNKEELAAEVSRLLGDESARRTMAEAGLLASMHQEEVMAHLLDALSPHLTPLGVRTA